MYTQNNIIKYALQTDHLLQIIHHFLNKLTGSEPPPEEQNNTLLNLREHSLVCARPTAQVS